MIVKIKGFEVIIDDEDFDRVIKGKIWTLKQHHAGKKYFFRHIQINNKSKHEHLHRIIINANSYEVVDHINGNTLDNRKCNLRICTHGQNNINHKKQLNNTTGFKGVVLDKRTGRFEARISINKKKSI